jgi:hypothetical protein
MLPAPRGVSPVAASFIAFLCLGILRVLLATCRCCVRPASAVYTASAKLTPPFLAEILMRSRAFLPLFFLARTPTSRHHDSIAFARDLLA